MKCNIENFTTEAWGNGDTILRSLRLYCLIPLSYISIAEYNVIRISTALRGMLRWNHGNIASRRLTESFWY